MGRICEVSSATVGRAERVKHIPECESVPGFTAAIFQQSLWAIFTGQFPFLPPTNSVEALNELKFIRIQELLIVYSHRTNVLMHQHT